MSSAVSIANIVQDDQAKRAAAVAKTVAARENDPDFVDDGDVPPLM